MAVTTESKATLTSIERQPQKPCGESRQGRQDVIQALLGAAAAYRETLSAESIDVYWQGLCDLPAADVIPAIGKLIRTSKWFPKIAEIRELIEGKPEELAEAEAEAAWQRVLEYVNGWHPDIGQMSDSTIRLTRREQIALGAIGGIYRLWEEQDGGPGLPFMHRDFIKTWKISDHVEDILALPSSAERPRLRGSGFQSFREIAGTLKQLNPPKEGL